MNLVEVDVLDLSPNQGQKKKDSLLPKLLVGFVALLFISNVAVFSFLIGRSTAKKINIDDEVADENFFTSETLAAVTEEILPTPTSTSLLNGKVSPTPTPAVTTLVLHSNAEEDGFWTSKGVGSNEIDIQVGRTNDHVSRGLVSFEINAVPKDAVITSAKIRLYEVKTVGLPYNRMGKLTLDHLIYGDSLDRLDYGLPATSFVYRTRQWQYQGLEGSRCNSCSKIRHGQCQDKSSV